MRKNEPTMLQQELDAFGVALKRGQVQDGLARLVGVVDLDGRRLQEHLKYGVIRIRSDPIGLGRTKECRTSSVASFSLATA